MIKKINGFTTIEIIFLIALVGLSSIVFFIQKRDIEIISQDNTKKSSINAIYYSLEEVFYANNNYYPQTVDSNIIKSVDPAVFADPSGAQINTSGSDYSYTPTNCSDNKCKSYTLKTTLNNEADYIKTSQRN